MCSDIDLEDVWIRFIRRICFSGIDIFELRKKARGLFRGQPVRKAG